MLIYLFIMGVIGVIVAIIGSVQMVVNYEYGFDDEDFQLGAAVFALALFAPISIPLVVVGLLVFGCVISYKGCASIVKEIMGDFK